MQSMSRFYVFDPGTVASLHCMNGTVSVDSGHLGAKHDAEGVVVGGFGTGRIHTEVAVAVAVVFSLSYWTSPSSVTACWFYIHEEAIAGVESEVVAVVVAAVGNDVVESEMRLNRDGDMEMFGSRDPRSAFDADLGAGSHTVTLDKAAAAPENGNAGAVSALSSDTVAVSKVVGDGSVATVAVEAGVAEVGVVAAVVVAAVAPGVFLLTFVSGHRVTTVAEADAPPVAADSHNSSTEALSKFEKSRCWLSCRMMKAVRDAPIDSESRTRVEVACRRKSCKRYLKTGVSVLESE